MNRFQAWLKKRQNKWATRKEHKIFVHFYDAFLKGNYTVLEEGRVFRVGSYRWTIDKDVARELKKIARLLQYLEPRISSFTEKKQHMIRQIRDVHLLEMYFAYYMLGDDNQDRHIKALLDAFRLIQSELGGLEEEARQFTVDADKEKQRAFHTSIRAIENRTYTQR